MAKLNWNRFEAPALEGSYGRGLIGLYHDPLLHEIYMCNDDLMSCERWRARVMDIHDPT